MHAAAQMILASTRSGLRTIPFADHATPLDNVLSVRRFMKRQSSLSNAARASVGAMASVTAL